MTTKAFTSHLIQAGKEFLEDDVPQSAAALSFYAVTALPPLLILLVSVVGLVYDDQQAMQKLGEQMTTLFGPSVGETVSTIFENREGTGHGVASIIGFVILLFSASGFFAQLQKVLNQVWEVRVRESAGWMQTVQKRLLSMTTVLGIGFLLTISLVFSAVVAIASEAVEGWLGVSATVSMVGQFVVNLALLSALFSLLYKNLPDVKVQWRDVWRGGLFTALFFLIGKAGLAFYLSRADLGASYGSAGALVLLLFWIYGSLMLVLFGAEYTEVYIRSRGGKLEPEPHAEIVPGARKSKGEYGVGSAQKAA
jgi:membrane protein